jgi:PAS domain S-box-containing protein
LKSLLGFADHEIPNHIDDWRQLVHPHDAELVRERAQAHIAGETLQYEVEHRMLHKAGGIRWFLGRGNVVIDADGRALRMVGTNTDITERKQAEDAIRQRDQLLQAMFHSLSSQVVVLNDSGAVTYASKSCEKLGQASQSPPLTDLAPGFNFLDICHTAAAAGNATAREVLDGIKGVISGAQPAFTMEYPAQTPGAEQWFLMQVDSMPREHGGVVISHTDITQRKLAEESAQRALAEVRVLKDRLDAENVYLQEEIRVARNFGEIIGDSEALKSALRLAEQVAPLDTTVLILGETGTGKELLAHAIHGLSPRHKRALVKVNCATLPAQLIESELFGHEKGAFTGAINMRPGRFEIANGGTIFLDEVGELPVELQTKLLRVLQEGEFEHLGSSRTIRVDVRVIAATNRDLKEAVREGSFRSDLFYRLSIFPITLPPLRERREDIPMLVTHFVNQLSRKLNRQIRAIPQETMVALQNYPWPGNVRELSNVIERAAIITQGSMLRLLDSLGSMPLKGPGPPTSAQPEPRKNVEDAPESSLDRSQYELILKTLEMTYWRVEGADGAAELLKIHPNTLRSRMKRFGISKPKYKTQP